MRQPLPLSVQLYTVRENLATDWEGTLERIAEMGFVGVEMAGFAYADVKEKVIGKIKELGMQISSAHFELPIGEVQGEILDAMHAMGSDKLICAWVSPDNFKSIDSIKALVEKFNESNAVAKAAGLKFGYHNHWFEFGNVDGRSALQVMIDEGMDDDIFFEIDTYWVKTARMDPAAVIAQYADRIPLLHIKDGPTGYASNMTAVGSGVMDFHKIIPAATSAEWLVVELDRCDTDMLTAVEDSINWLTAEGLGRGR